MASKSARQVLELEVRRRHGIRCLHGYLIHIAEQAEAAHRNGLSSAEAAETIDLGEYATCLDAERVVVNIYQRYRELDLPQRNWMCCRC
jgi:hypothetical protein